MTEGRLGDHGITLRERPAIDSEVHQSDVCEFPELGPV